MELQALLVLCGIGVASVAVLLLMGLFSTSGTSYEEAIAQQRKATTELLALAEGKNKNKKNSKKAIKKQAKKEKKDSVATGSEPESEAPAESGVEDEPELAKVHVEFNEEVVVEEPRDTTPNVKIRKRGKDPKVKPILLNKDDPSCVSDPVALATPAPSNVTNHFEEMHPKDEFELLLSQSTVATEKPQEKIEEVVEKKENKPSKGKGKALAAKAAVAEPAKEEAPRERHNSGDAPKEQRKAKKAEKKVEKVEEVIEVTREKVIPPLNAPQPSELTTEKLLKQALVTPPVPVPATATATATPPGGKKKKKNEPNVLALMAGDSGGVNVSELVRVVREAALSRTEIQVLTDTLLNKHHDPLPEHAEWTEGPNDPMQKLKKQLADKEKALADEIEASQGFQSKLKELRANLNAERSRVASATRAAEQAAAAARAEAHTVHTRLQRLIEENHNLTQDKLMLQAKLGAEGEAQAQRVQMEMHIQRLSEGEAALLQQIAGLQAECQVHAAAARDSAIMAQQHAAEMAQQLQEANRACGELEQQRQMALHAEQRAQQELHQEKQELHQAQERLAGIAELQIEVQRLACRAQTAEKNAEKIMEEAEKQKQKLSSEITALGEQLAARESELAELKQMKAAPAQNGLPTNDTLKAAELAKVESVVESLRGELAAAQRGSLEQRDQLARLNDQVRAYQDKNNELRTKNWKVMEALQSAEKALQTRSPTAMSAQELREAISKAQEAQYAEVATVLRAACPALAPGDAAGRDWLQAFADNLNKEFQKREAEKLHLEKKAVNLEQEKKAVKLELESKVQSVAPVAADPRLDELQAEKKHLQGLVDKYKTIIDDTEGVLSRLQQNVSTEEQRWAKQLSEKQQELDELRQRTVSQMQNKIDALEAQLSQEKATKNNHSFAEAERLTEEKLLAGLSEKLNGPSQVSRDRDSFPEMREY